MTTSALTATFYRGDIVTIDHPRAAGKTFLVVRRNRTTYSLQEVGNSNLWKAGPGLLRQVTSADQLQQARDTLQKVALEPHVSHHPGSFVRWTPPKQRPQLFVVLADKGDKVNIAVLGGDSGRYWRAPRAQLIPVPLAELPAALAG
jgi:hypothetical protein